ncbi:MAG: malonate transporter subunit MadL [Saprospiraceae bacterium]
MIIYGVAVLAACYIVGLFFGEYLGNILNINANVGGVGFAMLLLILVNYWLKKRNLFTRELNEGVGFWSNMYIPVIVAMSGIQNVVAAMSQSMVALLAGILPTGLCFILVYIYSKRNKSAIFQQSIQ